MKRWHGLAALALGATIIGGGAVSAQTETTATRPHGPSFLTSIGNTVNDLARFVGLDEQSVAPGTLDDGKDLLPQATISLAEAIATAQTAATGAVGEVDLEHFHGKLVFNVDVGNYDVKVDATTGDVLGSLTDD